MTENLKLIRTRLDHLTRMREYAAVVEDRFNYTEWRRTALPEIDLAELSRRAAAFSKQQQN